MTGIPVFSTPGGDMTLSLQKLKLQKRHVFFQIRLLCFMSTKRADVHSGYPSAIFGSGLRTCGRHYQHCPKHLAKLGKNLIVLMAKN